MTDMNDWLFLVLIIIVGILAVGQIVVLNRLLRRDLPAAISRQIVPLTVATEQQGTQTAQAIDGLAATIIQTHQQLQRSAQQLAGSVGALKPLSDGVSETTRSLAQTHTELQSALASLAAPGAVQDWVGTFSQAVQPLQQAGATIDQHYKLNGEVLRLTGDLLRQWNAQAEGVHAAADRIANLLETWTSSQELSRSERENEQREQLQRINQQIGDLREAGSTLNLNLNSFNRTVEALAKKIEATMHGLDRLTHLQQESAQQQGKLVQNLERMLADQTSLKGALREIGGQTHHAAENVLQMQNLLKEVNRDVAETNIHAMQTVRTQATETIAHLRTQTEETAAQQVQLIESLRRTVSTVPSRWWQIASLAVGSLSIVLLVLILFTR
jgi:ABC-type transporter Mla subunit MlaD